MQEKLNNIFAESSCLTENQLFDYSQNKLQPKEKNLVERHLMDCDFCSDAVEGYQKLGSIVDISSLKSAILQKSQNKKKPIIWMMAASIALLIGLIYTFNPSKNTDSLISEHKEEASLPPKEIQDSLIIEEDLENKLELGLSLPDSTKSIVTVSKEESIKSNFFRNEESEAALESESNISEELFDDLNYAGNSEGPYNEVEDDVKMEESNDLFISDQEVIEEKEIIQNVLSSPEEIKALNKADNYSNARTSTEVIESTTRSKEGLARLNRKDKFSKSNEKKVESGTLQEAPMVNDSSFDLDNSVDFDSLSPNEQDTYYEQEEEQQLKSMFEVGVELYEKKNYKEAIKFLEKAVKSNKKNHKATLYMGISYFEVDQFDNAINMFDIVISKGNKLEIEEALWYKAIALIKKGKKSNAKKVLEKVITFDGDFKVDAESKLRELNE